MVEVGRSGAGPLGRVLGAASAAALALACAGSTAAGGPDAPVRLDAPAEVGWEPGGPFALRLELHNASGYTLSLARPQAEALQVQLFRPDGSLACRTPTPTHRQYEAREVVPVRAAGGVPLRVDVRPYCPDLSPGVYRYEAVFVANPAQGGAGIAYVGTLGPRGGRVAVGEGLSRDPAALAAALAAALDGPTVNHQPPLARPAAPPAGAEAGGAGSAAADAARDCVDRELARRGLNAYGDPQGTRYEGGPPADEGGRVLYVAGRNAEIRRACRVGP